MARLHLPLNGDWKPFLAFRVCRFHFPPFSVGPACTASPQAGTACCGCSAVSGRASGTKEAGFHMVVAARRTAARTICSTLDPYPPVCPAAFSKALASAAVTKDWKRILC